MVSNKRKQKPHGNYCIYFTGTVVRCINVGFSSIPVHDIPDDVTELYLNMNHIRTIPAEMKKFTKLIKL